MPSRGTSTGGLIAIATTALFLIVLTSGLLSTSQNVPATGTISSLNVGVYTDAACTMNCTSINWGTLSPGNRNTQTVYIKNSGLAPITLSMSNSTWVPSNANNYLTLTWNGAGYVLNPNQSVAAIITLAASANAGSITNFSFNIIITGTQ